MPATVVECLQSYCASHPLDIMAVAAEALRRDFLAQELNRESNTLCAKSNDVELTLAALEENNLANEVIVVRDGAEALDYLHRRGIFKLRAVGQPAVAPIFGALGFP